MNNGTEKKGITLITAFLLIGLVPLFTVAVILTARANALINKTVEQQAFAQLSSIAAGLIEYYQKDINEKGTPEYDHEYVDLIKEQGYEVTLFLENKRYITSIKKDDGTRNEGTTADETIYSKVKSGETVTQKDVNINGVQYYVAYLPIHNSKGEFVGMGFAGMAQAATTKQIKDSTNILFIQATVIALIFALIVVYVAVRVKKTLAQLNLMMKTLASGDLANEIEVKSNMRELRELAGAAVEMRRNITSVVNEVISDVEAVENNMGTIAGEVEACNHACDSIVCAIEELASGSTDTADSVQNTSVSMQNIGKGISEIAGLAGTATGATDEAEKESKMAEGQLELLRKASEDTFEISHRVADGINQSAEAIENIKKAADTIAEIASETALLSLNASIEAARAGEAGRGFAVVADEISKLATQSDSSTTEIQGIVAEIINTSEANVNLAQRIMEAVRNEGLVLEKVRDSFGVVNEKVSESSKAVTNITNRSKVVDGDKTSILSEIDALSAITEENAASCQETNASMEELKATVDSIQQHASDTADLSVGLRKAVSFFKI